MDVEACFDRLDANTDDPEEVAEHFQRREARGHEYYALPDARHGLLRGTVCIEGSVVAGFPSIPRVLVLDAGIESFFDGRVAVAEKLDGYNVRVARVPGEDGEVLAFTRSGYVCPFTTERARELLPVGEFFADHPDLMLCAELVGPETPYTDHDYDDVETDDLRVFGVRERASGDPLDVEPRRDLLDEYGVDQPRLFGVYDREAAVAEVREAVAELDEAGREGVVMSSLDGADLVKYTTRSKHHDELAYAFDKPFEHGRDFVFSRVVREAFQSWEFDDEAERRERARDLGESILLPMVETIEDVAEGETPGEEHTVRGDPETLDRLLDHLEDLGLTLSVTDDDRESEGRPEGGSRDGQRVVEFLKVAESTRDQTEYYLDGGTRDE